MCGDRRGRGRRTSPNPLGTDAIDALDGLPLSALTLSPKLRLAGSEQVGADTLQTYERK